MKKLFFQVLLTEKAVINGQLIESVWIKDNDAAGALIGYSTPLKSPKKLIGFIDNNLESKTVNLICVERKLFVDNEQS